jgi:hypothetical protein
MNKLIFLLRNMHKTFAFYPRLQMFGFSCEIKRRPVGDLKQEHAIFNGKIIKAIVK